MSPACKASSVVHQFAHSQVQNIEVRKFVLSPKAVKMRPLDVVPRTVGPKPSLFRAPTFEFISTTWSMPPLWERVAMPVRPLFAIAGKSDIESGKQII